MNSDTEPGAPGPRSPGDQSEALEALRAILLGDHRQRLPEVEAQLRALGLRVDDREGLIATLTPVMGEVIQRTIHDSRDEMVEALYPIIGQLVVRAVSEAMRDLARSIDARMRTSFSPATALRRLRARLSGVSDSETVLRAALPFDVTEVFLVHRETGLLLRHLSSDPVASPDSDLISGMLTAIRDFVQDAFGRGQEGQLDEVQYGERRILIEAARHAYLAVVVTGIERPGYRAEMRDRIIAVEHEFTRQLEDYDGDATRFAGADLLLRPLMAETPPTQLRPAQKRLLAALAGLMVICGVTACLAGLWVRRVAQAAYSRPVIIVVTATAQPTLAPTATLAPTPVPPQPTPTAPPTATATFTPVPTAVPSATPPPTARPTTGPPVVSVGADGVNLRVGPGTEYGALATLSTGQQLSVMGRDTSGAWLLVCCTGAGQSGWVAAPLVAGAGTLENVPVVQATPLP